MPKLYIENGPDRGKSYVITADGPFFVGRDAAAQVALCDEMISRRHFQVEVRDGVHHVRDLGSSNGTYLNGRPIKGILPLASNDRIELGDTMITFLDEKKPSIIGSEIAGYRILDRIGRGGMGTVYRALQTSLDRVVALKILSPQLTTETNFVNLFIREARAAGALSHPNIVQVYDVGVEGDLYFFSMEYIPHGSVEDILIKDTTLGVDRSLRVVRDATLGLEYAEQKGIIHRDIKPGNLMVGSAGIVKIGDLGIARSTEGAGLASQKDGVSGSPHYIAPEQARGQDIDHRVDIYSLGISFYQMLCGKTPYSGTTPREVILKHIKEDPPRLSERAPDVPDDVTALVHRMMARERDDRPVSATVLLKELEPCLLAHGDEEIQVAPPGGGWKKVVAITVGATILSAVLIGGFLVVKHNRDAEAEQARVEGVWSETLAEVDVAVASGRYLQASELLGELGGEPPTPELGERRDIAFGSIEAGEAADALEKREEAAKLVLVDILEGDEGDPEFDPDLEDEDILDRLNTIREKLKKFIAEHADLDAAARARTQLASYEDRIKYRVKLERELEAQLRSIRTRVDTLLPGGAFNLAWDQLVKFEEEHRAGMFRDTWQGILDDVLDAVAIAWADIQSDCEEESLDECRSKVVAFLLQLEKFPPEVREPVESFRDDLDATIAARDAGRDTPADDPLGPVLLEAWKDWATNLSRSRHSETRLELQREARRFPAATQQRLKDHAEFLGRWREVFLSFTPRSSEKFSIELDYKTVTVTVEEIDLDHGGGARLKLRLGPINIRHAKLVDLKPADLAEIVCGLAETPLQKLYAGFLAAVLGFPDLARETWAEARSAHGAEIDALEGLIAETED